MKKYDLPCFKIRKDDLMRITDLLRKDCIALRQAPKNKEEAIEALLALQKKSGCIRDTAQYKKAILAREALGSTAVGDGIAIPHAKSEAVIRPSLAAMTVPNGVDYKAADGKNSTLLFMIAAPLDGDVHLEVLSRLMTMLMDEAFRARLLRAQTPEDFLHEIDRFEKSKYPSEAERTDKSDAIRYRILAVTACPTGIAHTYMAAEALEKAGERMNCPLKAETNGSGGVKNVLTDEEIKLADGIIIAADKAVETARFDGKKLISVSVSDGIRRPEELIKRVLSPETPIFRSRTKASPTVATDESFGRKIYKHLMNGVSHMLPFVVGGGIFIALAFLIDTLSGAPQNADFGSYTPTATFFKGIGGYAFNFMIPVLSAYIAESIADRPGLLVGFVGGFLATTGSTFASIGGDIPSGFLGALLAGFVGGYLMLAVERLCSHLPDSLEGIKPVLLYPLIGLGLVSVVMCLINPFMGMINSGLTDFLTGMNHASKFALGLILGGMMAIDMGGPFNKAAYVFGTAAITSGNYDIMAAVMIGGMIPPLAIALAANLFKYKFTEEERKNAPVNYIMGLSFITEGAIPYAAADPLHVIPACILGSALAGGLSMFFRCTLMAPHGGIFVFAVVGNWPQYVLSLIIGTVVSALALGFLKKAPRGVSDASNN